MNKQIAQAWQDVLAAEMHSPEYQAALSRWTRLCNQMIAQVEMPADREWLA
jgi:hypothetical protein